MTDPLATRAQTQAAERHFAGLVDTYAQAFQGGGRTLFQRATNRVFRRDAFRERVEIVAGLLARHGVTGKRVLDLGCGTGELARRAADLGATVTGLDLVPGMVDVARHEAETTGAARRCTFRVHDITQPFTETADVTLLIGVIEYYHDLGAVLPCAAAATRELLIVQDASGPWWRRLIRRMVAYASRVHLEYRAPREVADTMTKLGFTETKRVIGSSFTIMTFRPARP